MAKIIIEAAINGAVAKKTLNPNFAYSPQEIADHYDFDLKLVRDIALLVDRSEYKRKQAAPGLKITSRAFGFGRPFPIAQRFIP